MSKQHSVSDAVHQLFHHVGQSHSHNDNEESQFQVDYSAEAFEHCNPNQDGSAVGIRTFSGINVAANLPSTQIVSWEKAWFPPDLRLSKPPPKA